MDKNRSITIAKNNRKKQIEHVLELRDEMIENKIDKKLINNFLNESYEKINKQYEDKINKISQKESKKKELSEKNELERKRKKAIEYLLKNKAILEEKGVSQEYINNYIEKQYQQINQFYLIKKEVVQEIDLDQVNFID